MRYNPAIVSAFLAGQGVPRPEFEYRFKPDRRWRFDLAWDFPDPEGVKLAVEVQGGIWSGGRHNRGAAMLKEWEKLNSAACLGWRILYVQPSDLCLVATAQMIREALNLQV